jgi:hypothetical protein
MSNLEAAQVFTEEGSIEAATAACILAESPTGRAGSRSVKVSEDVATASLRIV